MKNDELDIELISTTEILLMDTLSLPKKEKRKSKIKYKYK